MGAHTVCYYVVMGQVLDVCCVQWTRTSSGSRSQVKSLDALTVTIALPMETQGIAITDENKVYNFFVA